MTRRCPSGFTRQSFFVALMALTGVALASPVVAQTPPEPPVIVAQGQSVLKAEPDQAWATVAIETRDTRAPEARRLAAIAMTSVMAALKATGLPADAVKTIGFSLSPDYEYVNGRQRMRGFIVSNQVQVRMDEIAKVADVLDAVGGLTLAASSNLTITGLRFDLKNRTTLERAALRAAVEDALARAKAMAAGAGTTVGRIVRIDERGSGVEPIGQERMMFAGRAGDAAVSTPIAPSEVEIRASVVLTVEIR